MKVVGARRIHLPLYSVATLIFLALPIFAQDQLPDLVRRIKPSAVAIETFDARGEQLSRGSGFFVDVDRVVTNRHVIDRAYRPEFRPNCSYTYQANHVIDVA